MSRHLFLLLGLACALMTSLAAAAPVPEAKPDNNELHVVCVRSGARPDGADRTQPGEAAVRVDRPGKVITLVLCSTRSTTWDVTITAQTRLNKVVLGGFQKQVACNLPEKVEVVSAFSPERTGFQPQRPTIPPVERIDSSLFRSMVRRIHELTGQEIASYQGVEKANPAQPIVVNQVQSDARLLSDFPRPTPVVDLPKLAFRALEYTPLGASRMQAGVRSFTLAGPTNDASQPLPPDVQQLTLDLASKKAYGLKGKEIVEVDLTNGQATPLAPGLDTPQGIAFDSKRNRVLVMGKRLYAFDPAGAKWSALAEIEGLDPLALAYHPGEDAAFTLGISQDRGDFGKYMLVRLDDKGAAVEKVRLGEVMFEGVLGLGSRTVASRGNRAQLVASGNYLIVLATDEILGVRPPVLQTYMFLVEPKTGKVQLTWRNPER
jgi:hypothetical protein